MTWRLNVFPLGVSGVTGALAPHPVGEVPGKELANVKGWFLNILTIDSNIFFDLIS